MNDRLVSVIIPVYNSAFWVGDCLESVLVQSCTDLEILCVDDGSTDKSVQVIRSLMEKDPRISLDLQENHGPGYARNRMIEKARGKYILFLDSDDKLEAGFLADLLERAEKDSLDMLAFDMKPFYETEILQKEHPELAWHHQYDYPGVWDGRDLFRKMLENKDYSSAGCLAFYRRGFLIENHIGFAEEIFHEDELICFSAYLNARRAGFQPNRGYLRRLRDNSTMTKKRSVIHVRGRYRISNLMSELCFEKREFLRDYPEFFDYAIGQKLLASYMYQNNRAEIQQEPQTQYDRMMLSDLDNYGSKAELDAVYGSSSWRLGNRLVRPLHALKVFAGRLRKKHS